MGTHEAHAKQFEVAYTEPTPTQPTTHDTQAEHLKRPYVEPPLSPPTTHDFQAAFYTVTD